MAVVDQIGFETLQTIEKAENFNRWMYATISNYCSGNILEIGSGIGNISSFFVSDGFSITLTDIDSHYIDVLKKRFAGNENVKEIFSVDLQEPEFENTYSHLREKYDTIVMLNVLEHLKNESIALQNCSFLLKPEGTLVILVPAYSWLYSKMDVELGHKKRYTAIGFEKLFNPEKNLVVKTFYFNAIGIPASFYGKILRFKKIPSREISLFNHLTGLGKLIDKLLFNKAGLSVISITKKIF